MTIVLAQLFGTSLWFSINGVWLSYASMYDLNDSYLGYLTLSVQFGFILGTLLLAISGLADRFKASEIFAIACFIGAGVNLLMTLTLATLVSVITKNDGPFVTLFDVPGLVSEFC